MGDFSRILLVGKIGECRASWIGIATGPRTRSVLILSRSTQGCARLLGFVARRSEVEEYLGREGVAHGPIGEGPAWSVAPYVSIWAVATLERPGSVGWWAITGDLSNDYVCANDINHPRNAMRAIATLWQEASEYMLRGGKHPTFRIGVGDSNDELAPLLVSRAETLLGWADDPEVWEDDDL